MRLLTLCDLFSRFMGFLLDLRHKGIQRAGSAPAACNVSGWRMRGGGVGRGCRPVLLEVKEVGCGLA